MTRTHFTLAEQLGRFWEAQSGLGLTFAGTRHGRPAHIYADRLPDAGFRLSPGVAIVPTTAAPTEAMSPTHAVGLAVEVHAQTRREAFAVLEDLWLSLWPTDRPYSPVPETVHGQSVVGVLGIPAATVGGEADLWRIVSLVHIQIPTLVQGASQAGATAAGLEMATMTMTARCVRVSVNTPSIAFSVVVADDSAYEAATIEVLADKVWVRVTPTGEALVGTELLYAANATIGALRAAIAAVAGVTVGDIDESLDGRASEDLVAMAQTDMLGVINTRDLAVAIEE